MTEKKEVKKDITEEEAVNALKLKQAENIAKATEGVNKVLDEFNCFLDPIVTINSNGIDVKNQVRSK